MGKCFDQGRTRATGLRGHPTNVIVCIFAIVLSARAMAEDFTNQPFVVPNVPGHIAPIRALAFSRDSTRLYSAGDDKAVIAWERSADSPLGDTWRYARHIRWEADWGQMGSLNALACSPKSESIVFGGYGYRSHFGTFAHADGLEGRVQQTINEPHASRIGSLRYSSQGNTIVSADMRGMVVLWSEDLRRSRTVRPAAPAGIPTVFFPIALLGSDRLLVPEWEDSTKSWLLVEQSLRVNASAAAPLDDTRFRGGVAALETNASGEWIAAVGLNEQHVTIWRRVDSQWRKSVVQIPQGSQPRAPLSLSFLPDNRTLAIGTTASKDNGSAVILWDVIEGRECDSQRKAGKTHVFACATSPNGEWLAYVSGTGNDLQIEGRGARAGRSQRLAGGVPISAVSFDSPSPPYRIRLTQELSSSTENVVFDPSILKMSKNEEPHRPRPHSQWSLRRSAKTAGEYVVLEGTQPRGTINLNSLQSRYVSHQWLASGGAGPTAVAIGADRENRILVFQLPGPGLDNCPLVMNLAGHFSKVSALAQSADGRRLLSGGADGMASYWDLVPLADKSPLFRRWGMQLADQQGKVVVTRIHESTAAYYRGLREGDEITRIKWSKGGDITELVDSGKILAGLKEAPFTTPVHFTTQRRGMPGPSLQVESLWLPLLTVFPWNDEWISWTPSALYAASLGGEKAIGWLINHDLQTAPDFFSASRFRKTLYRPDLIPKYLNTGNLGAEHPEPSMSQRLPPRIEGLVFETADRVDPQQRRVRIRGASFSVVARFSPLSSEPTTQLQLMLNQRPWQQEIRRVNKQGEFAHEWKISLTPGEHYLQVIAENGFGKSVSELWTLDVDYDPNHVTDRLFVLAIGAVHPEDQNSTHVATDAASMTETLQDRRRTQSVFDNVEIEQRLGAEATRDKIRNGFDWLRKQMREGSNDVGLLYFCGIGFSDQRTQRNYLLPSDGEMENPETCISEDEIRRLCRDVGGRGRMIIALDASPLGNFDTEPLARDFGSDDYNVIGMIFTGRSRVAQDRNLTAGLFTKVLKSGLEARSDRDGNKRVSHVELAKYLRSEIMRATADLEKPIIVLPWETPRIELTTVIAP
ncbi:MAG: caspase family protein [Pirellulales bacterium]